MLEHLLETWAIHNRINLYLLDAVPETALANVGQGRGRSVGAQFAHIHNVRLMWLQSANQELSGGLAKLAADQSPDKQLLRAALSASADAITALVRAAGSEGKIRGFKPHPVAFVGYLISHESHHRGQIVLTLKQTGVPVDKKVLYGMWEWGVR